MQKKCSGAPEHLTPSPVWDLWLEMVTQWPGFCPSSGLAVLCGASSHTIKFTFTVPNTQQKVSGGLLSRTWKQGNKFSACFFWKNRTRENMEWLLPLYQMHCDDSDGDLGDGSTPGKYKWEFHWRRISQLAFHGILLLTLFFACTSKRETNVSVSNRHIDILT